MKNNIDLESEIANYLDHVIVVEGKKDAAALEALGFNKVYMINRIGVPIREQVRRISQETGKKRKICILTDFDKKGKQLYLLLKRLFQEQGARLDAGLRGVLLKAGVSHIEGLDSFMQKSEAGN